MKLENGVDFPENSGLRVDKKKDKKEDVIDYLCKSNQGKLCSLIGEYGCVSDLEKKMAPLNLNTNSSKRLQSYDLETGVIIGSQRYGYSLALPKKERYKNNYLSLLKIDINKY